MASILSIFRVVRPTRALRLEGILLRPIHFSGHFRGGGGDGFYPQALQVDIFHLGTQPWYYAPRVNY